MVVGDVGIWELKTHGFNNALGLHAISASVDHRAGRILPKSAKFKQQMRMARTALAPSSNPSKGPLTLEKFSTPRCPLAIACKVSLVLVKTNRKVHTLLAIALATFLDPSEGPLTLAVFSASSKCPLATTCIVSGVQGKVSAKGTYIVGNGIDSEVSIGNSLYTQRSSGEGEREGYMHRWQRHQRLRSVH